MPQRELTREEVIRYGRISSNWTYLAAWMAGPITIDEIGIVLHIELAGRCRGNIINRLIGRLGSMLRGLVRDEVYQLADKMGKGLDF
jgi:hypothetical protein